MSNLPGIAFLVDMFAQPAWLIIWVCWLGVVNFAALAFWKARFPRVAFALFFAAMVAMAALHAVVGWVRLLGLPHVIFWTPLWVLAWREWRYLGPDAPQRYRTWLVTLLWTDGISLILDYSDVIRWLLGERGQ
ncbi:MAG: hypothetical protein D6761_04655 [Candidatus Dadabacteria bacterium]|nr:MAG: hypothetical protein D6761_04655 [Candidatus Dadabacteria bacterium]